MSHALLCSVGAVLALVGHLPNPARVWTPHALACVMMIVVLAVPSSMVSNGGAALLGLLAGWLAVAGGRRRQPAASLDLAAMALLLSVHARGMTGAAQQVLTGHHAAPADVAGAVLPLTAVVVWALGRLVAQRKTLPGSGHREPVVLIGGIAMLGGMLPLAG